MTFSTLIIGFFVVAIFQWLYQAVVAPLLRGFLKEKILCLRHRLLFGHATSELKDDRAVEVIASSITNLTDNLHNFNLYLVYRTRRLIRTEGRLAALVEERNLVIDKTIEPGLRDIVVMLDEYLFRALVINSGGLLLWLWPVLLVAYMRRRIFSRWSERLKSMVRSFVFVPEIGVVR